VIGVLSRTVGEYHGNLTTNRVHEFQPLRTYLHVQLGHARNVAAWPKRGDPAEFDRVDKFRQGLKETGYVEAQNVSIRSLARRVGSRVPRACRSATGQSESTRRSSSRWMTVDSAMKRVVQAGGKVLGEPLEIPGVGRYVSFFDTEGNRVSMMQPNFT
jgi:hypothetical protein